MISVDASDLKKELNALAEFLQSKLKTSIKIDGKVLVIEDSNTPIRIRDVKMQMKHFLHHKGFSKEYRVIVGQQVVIVSKVDKHKKRKAFREEGRVPHPAETMPWFFPWRT